jgi:hypothetical protein
VLSLLILLGTRLADGQLWDEVRYLEGEEIETVPLSLFEVRVGPHGGDRHLHGPVEGVFVEAGCFVGSTPNDHRVNDGATSSTAAEGTTRGGKGMLSREVMILNHANTFSVEDNLRKRNYSHSPANGIVTATTSLHAWCRDNISVRAVA